MAKNSLKKITEKNHWKKSLKKFKRIWSVFKLSNNLTIMYFQILLNHGSNNGSLKKDNSFCSFAIEAIYVHFNTP